MAEILSFDLTNNDFYKHLPILPYKIHERNDNRKEMAITFLSLPHMSYFLLCHTIYQHVCICINNV